MSIAVDDSLISWVRESLGSRVEISSMTPLAGGLSQAVHRVELRRADLSAVVLRRWPGDAPHQEDHTRREAAALRLLSRSGSSIGAPELIASDPSGERSGRSSTLMSLLPGAVDLTPVDPAAWTAQLAEHLASLHAITPAASLEPCEWLSDLEDPERLDWMGRHSRGHAALDLARSARTGADLVIGHGDYQHFNVLWDEGRLVGIVDWTMSGQANPGKDLGHCMLNIAVLHDADRAWDLLLRYEAITGRAVDRGWVVRELLDFSAAWEEFIPIQVSGRTPVDAPGMRGRVSSVIGRVVDAS